jgi:uncharacterized protein (UPF0335 family)
MSANTAAPVVAQDHKLLRGYITRIENLMDTKKDISNDIKDVYEEAAGEGFDKKALRTVISRRQKDKAEVLNLDSMVELYESNI